VPVATVGERGLGAEQAVRRPRDDVRHAARHELVAARAAVGAALERRRAAAGDALDDPLAVGVLLDPSQAPAERAGRSRGGVAAEGAAAAAGTVAARHGPIVAHRAGDRRRRRAGPAGRPGTGG